MDSNAGLVGQVVNLLKSHATWSGFIIAVTLLLPVRIAYNLYFHPLSSYRGPTYLVASDLPLAFLQLRGTSQYALKKAHDKYGTVVRIAPNTLSFIEPSAWNDIYGSRNGVAALIKDPQFYNEMLLEKDMISIANDHAAKPIRKAMYPAFSHKALLELEPMLRGHIGCLIAQLTKTSQRQGSVDMRTWSKFFFFDILSDFAFGEDLGCVRDGIYHEWAQFVVDFFYAATLIHQCHKFWPLNKVLALLIPSSVRDRKKRHSEASLQRVRRRIHSSTDRPDFMSYFLRQAEKEQLSKTVIEAQASVIILAGSETSAVTLTAALYYVISNDDIYRRLCEEVRSAFKTSADISLQGVLSRLPYLEACVQETLRIHTPIANGFPRFVADSEGATISGNWVPQNTVVMINSYCANWSAQNFRDPHVFVPERWLNDPVYDNDRKDVVQPFSVGPAECLGKRFALNNIQLTLAHLIWTFDMKLGDGARDWPVNQKVFNGWQQPALPVLLKERH